MGRTGLYILWRVMMLHLNLLHGISAVRAVLTGGSPSTLQLIQVLRQQFPVHFGVIGAPRHPAYHRFIGIKKGFYQHQTR